MESQNELRAPICCVLGHVDAGKTSLLDKLRTTHVADGEAGGITQQIGATYFPLSVLQQLIKPVASKHNVLTEIPGILILDTPGHASFTNLRSRGSSICDLAIVVVDYFDGIQPQTKESLMLLREHRTPFIVVVNKVDRIYEWSSNPESSISDCIKSQRKDIRSSIEGQLANISAELAAEGFNSKVYYKNRDPRRVISMVPVSAKSGDGIPDLIALIMQLTQRLMVNKLRIQQEVRCVVMEVKKTEGYGTTLDVILVNGSLSVGDRILVGTLNDPIVTTIRALLVPHNLQELRVRGEYNSVRRVTAAQCLKIAGSGLDDAVAGTSMYTIADELEACDQAAQLQEEIRTVERYSVSPVGIYVKASTLGSLQALHSYLTEKNVPIAKMSIGAIMRKDIIFASTLRCPCILAFDLEFTDRTLRDLAVSEHVEVITNNVMYQLVDSYLEYLENLRSRYKKDAVYPCELQLKRDWLFRASKPIVLGCQVLTGQLMEGMPLVSENGLELGYVSKILVHGKRLESEKGKTPTVYHGTECSIELADSNAVVAGRHFLKIEDETAYSAMSRRSINALKELKYKLSQDELRLIIKIKKLLNII